VVVLRSDDDEALGRGEGVGQVRLALGPRVIVTGRLRRLVSVVGSAATAGLTGAVVMLTLTLSTLGLPLAGVGLLLAIDPILDVDRYRSASADGLLTDDEPAKETVAA